MATLKTRNTSFVRVVKDIISMRGCGFKDAFIEAQMISTFLSFIRKQGECFEHQQV